MLPKSEGGASDDNPAVSVRTMDFNSTSLSYFFVVPRGLEWFGFTPDTYGYVNGMHWENKYGFVSVNVGGDYALTSQLYIDGMNEKGLSACTLWLDDAESPNVEKKDYPKTMCQLNVVGYILGMCETIDDVLAIFDKENPDIYVFQKTIKLPFLGDFDAPAHVAVHDANNNSVILEWVSKETFRPTIYTGDSYPNAITNDLISTELLLLEDPINQMLTPTNPFDYIGNRYSAGGGEVGLPGDSGDGSRWLRGYYLMPNAWPTAPYSCDVPWRVIQALRAMGRNDRFFGEGYDPDEKQLSKYSFTEWTLARDHTHKVLYYLCMKNQQVNTLKLSDYQTEFEQAKSLRSVKPLSTWYSTQVDEIDVGKQLNASIKKNKRGKCIELFIPVPRGSSGQTALFFLYARLADNTYAAWDGSAWRSAKRLSVLPSFHEGAWKSENFFIPLNDIEVNLSGARFYAGCGKSLSDMFINGNCSLISVGE